MRKGIKLLEEVVGAGPLIQRGRRIKIVTRMWLNKGDEVPMAGSSDTVWSRGELLNGIFYAMEGMREGGFRKVRISPHMMYREAGFGEMIPPNAVLTVAITLEEVCTPPA